MSALDRSEMDQLIATFLAEADEFTEAMESGLLHMEEAADDRSLLDKVFRAAHSLKGSSMAVGLTAIGSFTHEVEALLLEIKEGRISASQSIIGVLLKSNDHVKKMVALLKIDPKHEFDSEELLQEIASCKEERKASPQLPASGFGFFDEEESSAARSVGQPTPSASGSGSQDPKGIASLRPQQEQIKVSQDKIDRLVNNIGEMAILMSFLSEHLRSVRDTDVHVTMKQLIKIGKEVQDESISLRMVPVKPVFQKLKRIVRDLSAKLDKRVDMQFVGEDIEVDKTILDMINDPLVHIIRNAIDHGVESMEERVQRSKNPVGKIVLTASHENGRLVFSIKDDGAGINAQRVQAKAAKLGLIEADAELSQQEMINLLFHPGFSTKDNVTDISGRGVGMDVVKTNIEAMGGDIFITTEEGQGSCFRINLPQTFSIIDSTIVSSGRDRYVIPLNHILESVRITSDSLVQSTPIGPVFTLRGEKYPAFALDDLLGHSQGHAPQIAMLMRSHEQTFAILIDEIIGRQPVVIKNLGPEFQDYKEFSGSTILGDGKPALIVELDVLIRRMTEKKRSQRAQFERMSA